MKNIDEMKKDFGKGLIIVCPRCHKVDIDPYTHFKECNIGEEIRRQEVLDNYYK